MFTALLLSQDQKRTVARFERMGIDDLPPGDVTVRVDYSSLNFKDALAVTGRGAIVRKWPLVPGIDLAGVVEQSNSPKWKSGDRVVVNGWGIGEAEWGGYSQFARLSSDWLLRLPQGFDTRHAMAIGTAGYTAALCALALQRHGVSPEDGEVLVTGATGGVGSIAVRLLAGMGYNVTASTGKPQEAEYLQQLGAANIIDRAELASAGRPLQSERWAGIVDAVGSHTLANACAATKWYGAVASCGLAQGSDFPGSVMPFILRGITLYGINCVYIGNQKRTEAWALLAQHVSTEVLERMTEEIGLSEVLERSAEMLGGRTRGRTVVDVNR